MCEWFDGRHRAGLLSVDGTMDHWAMDCMDRTVDWSMDCMDCMDWSVDWSVDWGVR